MKIGCETLDRLLGGGVEIGTITEIYGEGGCGKTNFCLQLSRNAVRAGKRALFVDTEGVSLERLRQMSGDDYERVMKGILFFKPTNMEEQGKAIDDAIKLAARDKNTGVGLIVLDSATLFYRTTYGTDQEATGRYSLLTQMRGLLETARKQDLPVLITTQTYTNSERKTLEPIGGHAFYHYPKTILLIERIGPGQRVATIKKHRSRPEGISGEFFITDQGLVDHHNSDDEKIHSDGGSKEYVTENTHFSRMTI